MITDSRSNLAPSTKGCSRFGVLGLAGMGYAWGSLVKPNERLVGYRTVAMGICLVCV